MKNTFFFCTLFSLLFIPELAARKVISLSPAVTEMIFHLGAGDQLAGRSSVCDHPRQVKKLPAVGDFARPDTARVLALKPDLIVTNDLIVPGSARIFEQHKIEVLYLPCRSVSEYCQAVRRLGEALGAEPAARREIERIKRFTEECRRQAPLNKKVLAVIWSYPLIVSGGNTFLTELLQLAGGTSPDFKGVSGYFKPSLKFLLSARPDVLLVFEETRETEKHPQLKYLEAVKKKRIVVFPDSDLLQRPGPRFTEGVRILRKELEK